MSTFPGLVLARVAVMALAASALVPAGCANRDVKATDAGHPHGDGSAAEVAMEAGGDAATDMAMDLAVSDAPADLASSDAPDVAIERPTCPATARFNFENGALHGAKINAFDATNCPSCGQAFTAIANSGVTTFCGSGALEITAAFSGTDGLGTKGEVLIPLGGDAGTTEDLTNKTITIHASALPSSDVGFFLLLRTTAGYQTVPMATIRPVTGTWSTSMNKFAGDGGVTGEASVNALSLQAFSYTGYQGKIYIDEIDIQ
jgi:hypothetical protein